VYELNRIRLFGVGPRGARYTDVTLDLSDVGAAVTGQGSLFDAPARRPSPFSLLMLENGGGKSVLLKLLFSVVLPGKRQAVGGSAAVMEKFVVGDDAAHVVLEWMHVRTGGRVVTGKTLQWRRTRGADGSRLAEAWWWLRPHADVELGTLPFTRDGRRLRLDGFKDALEEIHKKNAATEVNWVGPEVGEWERQLRTLGIEPDLFAIQRRMNADEGDAASAFKFKSSKDFVDWLLGVVLDPEDAVSVAENFDKYATTVGDRQALVLEHEFVDGAVTALTPVAEAWTRLSEATGTRRAAELRGQELLAAVRARVDADTEAAGQLRGEHEAAVTAAGTRESERDRARDTVNELRRQTLVLEVAGAETARDTAAEQRDDADAELAAWAAVEVVEGRDAAEAHARELAERISGAEAKARPAQQTRDDAAGRLLAKLHAEVAAARGERDAHNDAAGAHKTRAGELDRERTDVVVAGERARGELRGIQETLAAARGSVEAAVAAGLLAAGADVPAAAETAAGDADLAEQTVGTAEADLATAEDGVRRHDRAARDADRKLTAARAAQERAAGALERVTARAVRLAADEHVRAVLGAETADVTLLDANAEAIADRLTSDITGREERLGELKAAQREDHRVLAALGDGGLLPARPEAEAALAALRAAGIAAHPGWRYLAENVTAAERAALIDAHPQLADGVVLVDPATLPAARELLAEALLLPAAAVAVGTGAGLLAGPAGDRAEFVVEPNPALFDTDAAEERRLQLRTVMDERGDDISTRDDQLARLRGVAAELDAWRRECPPGKLAEFAAELTSADAALGEAIAAEAEARAAAEEEAARRDSLAAALPGLRTAERAAADRAARLRALADQVAAAEAQRRRIPELEEDAAAADREVERLVGEREAKLAAAEEAARAAENARDRAERHLTEIGGVVSSTGAPAPAVPTEPVPALRVAYAAAQAAYTAVEVGQDLRAEATAAETKAAAARAQVAQLPTDTVARAEHLLTSPAAADRAGRAAETARVQRERSRYAEAFTAAAERVGNLRSELRAATPGDRDRNVWTTLPDERRPRTVDHGRELHATAIIEQRTAQELLEAAVTHAAGLDRAAGAKGEDVRAFGEVLTPLEAALEDADPATLPSEAVPYPDSAAAAREAAGRLRGARRAARRAETISRDEVDDLVDAAARFANDPRFEPLTTVARRSLLGLERSALAARAGEFAGQLAQRRATLATDLESAGRHRKLIVDRLAALADGALKTLRTASRLSRLPDGLGDWAGKEFLRIRFTEPDPSLLAARIGEVVDDIAAATAGRQIGARGTAPKRDGMGLLLKAVDAAVPKGFSVEVLKPDSVLRDERVAVEEMNDVFSGGQELTAAIVLYCTMAALRANERGQLRAKHSGVLFLDNPIGKASAEYLLDLQQGVAAALGVQLVYTTGLSDDRALAAFPLWVRMRNDADLRAGLKHIRVAELVRRRLPDPFTDDEADDEDALPGTVTATRVFRRPA
jgi:hypothetical protein